MFLVRQQEQAALFHNIIKIKNSKALNFLQQQNKFYTNATICQKHIKKISLNHQKSKECRALFQFGFEKKSLTVGMISGDLLRRNFRRPCWAYFSPSSKFSRIPAALFSLVTLQIDYKSSAISYRYRIYKFSNKNTNIDSICMVHFIHNNVNS